MPKSKYSKRADGRYYTKVLLGYKEDGKPDYKYLYARTATELDNKLHELKAQLKNGTFVKDETITVGQWAEVWFETYTRCLSHASRVRTESIIRLHIIPIIGGMRLTRVSSAEIQNLINQEFADGKSKSHINKVYMTLHQMFEKAIIDKFMYRNPCDGVDMRKYSFSKSEAEYLTEDEISKIVFFSSTNRNGAFLVTLLYTGMRKGEIIALTWDDVDLVGGSIQINKAVEYINNRPNIKLPKTNSGIRSIPILVPLKRALEKYRKEYKTIYGIEPKGQAPLFPSKTGETMSSSAYARKWKFINKDFAQWQGDNTESVHLRAHKFRHSFATILYNAGVDVKTAQQILGHSNIKITLEIYTHLEEKMRVTSTEKLNEYIEKNIAQNF